MDPCQLDRPFHTTPVLQIYGRRCCSPNGIRWSATVQRSGELLHDSLLYQEDIEPLKQSLPDDVDSVNEIDSESEEDVPVTISIEPVVAYMNDYDRNNLAENEGEWVLNENIVFDYYLCLKMYLSMLVPYTCLYQSQKWHACIYRTMKDMSSLFLLLKGPITNCIRQRPGSSPDI